MCIYIYIYTIRRVQLHNRTLLALNWCQAKKLFLLPKSYTFCHSSFFPSIKRHVCWPQKFNHMNYSNHQALQTNQMTFWRTQHFSPRKLSSFLPFGLSHILTYTCLLTPTHPPTSSLATFKGLQTSKELLQMKEKLIHHKQLYFPQLQWQTIRNIITEAISRKRGDSESKVKSLIIWNLNLY